MTLSAWYCPIVSTSRSPPASGKAPATVSAVYQPIEFPITPTMSTCPASTIAAWSASVQVAVRMEAFSPATCRREE
ncbi:MAG: hypothetical protein EXR69_11520 [Myxococcales bacterium]|nr:hypothetical protein [Myxococcales bacterium]